MIENCEIFVWLIGFDKNHTNPPKKSHICLDYVINIECVMCNALCKIARTIAQNMPVARGVKINFF
jgi:hypothetical protein